MTVYFAGYYALGVPRILQWLGFTWWGPGQGVWGRKSPSRVQEKALVGGLGDEVPQKLKKNVKLAYNF